MKNEKNTRNFILLAYAKGISHAVFIPYVLLWIFQGLGLKAFGISFLYISIVGTGYWFSKRHDLSRAAFYGSLLFVLAIAVFIAGLAGISTFQ